MKIIDKIHAFVFLFVVGCMIGFIFVHMIKEQSNDSIIEVQGTEQRFPMRLTKDYEIISAESTDETITIVIKDRFSGSEYRSSLPTEALRDRICGSYVYRKKYWDCSDEHKVIKSMILELGYKSIKLIN